MKRSTLASAILVSTLTLMASIGEARAEIASFTITSLLDDTCYVYVNGTLAGILPPFGTTPLIQVGPANVPGRTNLLLRCEDGGLYATSVEAIWTTCNFQVDEEGVGLTQTACYL